MRVYYKNIRGAIEAVEGDSKKHLIWGDWLDVEEDEPASDDFIVNWKVWDDAADRVGIRKYRVAKRDCQDDALLEMIFLDVGQGDGCIVNVPHGNRQRTLIVDAGVGNNTHRFLKWRFRYIDSNADFEAAVITHPDTDHYKGFQPIFDDERITFQRVFHNGLVERTGDDLLGDRAGGFCTDLRADRASLHELLADQERRGNKLYPKLLWTALQDEERFRDLLMASSAHGIEQDGRTYLPGFAPDGNESATIEILGPVPEEVDGRPALREFGDKPRDGKFNSGKTKNGHSVILKLQYGGLRVIFGGDLNAPAEDYLLRHYGGLDDQAELRDGVATARERLAADLLKCCHHGSADVTDEFLEAVSPFGVIVSSGDLESHVHPRPEVLGLLGKKGRGSRPIVLCTEILRSTPESAKLEEEEEEEHDRLLEAVAEAPDANSRTRAKREVERFWQRKLRRLVSVYGAINIRTDGQKLIVAFRKEKKAAGSPWQLYEYRLTSGEWQGNELGSGH